MVALLSDREVISLKKPISKTLALSGVTPKCIWSPTIVKKVGVPALALEL